MPLENNENHETHGMSCGNHEYKKNPCDNYENHDNYIIPHENSNIKKKYDFHVRIMKII